MIPSTYTHFVRTAVLSCLLSCCVHSARADWEWARTCDKTSVQSVTHSVTTDAAGNVIVAGIFGNTLIVGNDTLTADGKGMFVIKYDASGNILWVKAPKGVVGDLVPPAVTTDANNNIIISGHFGGELSFDSATVVHGGYVEDFFVVKYDPAGNALWAKAQGGDRRDLASAVTTDKAGNVFVTGYYNSTSITFGSATITNVEPPSTDVDMNKVDIFLAKYDANGNFQWVRNIGNKGSEKPGGVAADSAGNVYVAGTFVENDSAFLIGDTLMMPMIGYGILGYTVLYKFDGSGNRIWAKWAENGSPTHLAIGKAGDIFMGGILPGSVMSFGGRFDPEGIKLENYAYKTHYVCPDGKCLRMIDVFIARYTPNGQVLWARNDGGMSEDILTAMALDPADNIYIAGSSVWDTMYFDNATVIKDGYKGDKFWASYDSNGALKGASLGLDPATINSMAIAKDGAIYVAGGYYVNAHLGPIELVGSWSHNMFVAKCDERTLGVEQHIVPLVNTIGVYPNPNKGQMTVSLGSGGYKGIQVIDCVGRRLYSAALTGSERSLDLQLHSLTPGIYILDVNGAGKSERILFEVN